ncbi:hypothetical protein [Mangrovibacterium lignilyticum]|uniref:hypothetical protein n=1 Tax=Mangrovibacterium lignilyticum TaxID=2668052 RepID=UPI0013CFC3E1|nr:hypothetical protein [Mangrovibacterium lignilyticum]
MKKAVGFIALFILFAGLSSMSSYAQEEAPARFIVFEDFVSPSDMPAYWEAQTEACELWAKHKLDIPVYAYLNDENVFYWVIPIKNFASIDDLYAKFMGLHQAMIDEDDFNADEAFADLYTGRQSVIQWDKELSYHAAKTGEEQPDKPFAEWMFCQVRAGHEQDFDAAIKAYVDYYKNIGSDYEWDVYKTLLGPDTPTYIIMVRAEDEVAMRTIEKELNDKYKDDFEELWQQFSKQLRSYETKKGWFLPKLSNMPAD